MRYIGWRYYGLEEIYEEEKKEMKEKENEDNDENPAQVKKICVEKT